MQKVEITCSDQNNWKIGKYYIQTLPKALVFANIEDETLLKAYDESFEAFKRRSAVETTSSKGEYKIERESGSALFSRNIDRLYLLAFESLLKQFVAAGSSIEKSLENIKNDVKPEKKAFGKNRREG